ncbi:MAG TPA: leucine-rich repeat domain-containing protein [Planctomycetaceae bacterium]|nr:leucine-rich repeat domain-containing protein [Planctomycetaceae bacterium]
MTRQRARALMLSVLTALVIPLGVTHATSRSAPAGPIPDKALEAVVRSVIFDKKDKPDELTDDDLKKVYILEGKGKGIKDLAGLEKCINLLQLNLAKNEIANLAPLKDIKNLQSLDLSNNKIVDAGPLGNIVALQFLELSDNQIVSVEPLGKLTKLSALYIAGNKIADPAPLSALTKLSSLDLARNQLSDIKGLTNVAGLSLLKLSDNQISDLAPLGKPLSVRMLLLERNKITDLAPLVAAARADADGEKRFAPFLRLYLGENPLSEGARTQQIDALKAAGVKVNLGEPADPKKPK